MEFEVEYYNHLLSFNLFSFLFAQVFLQGWQYCKCHSNSKGGGGFEPTVREQPKWNIYSASKWMIPGPLVQLFEPVGMKIFLEFSRAILDLFQTYFGAKIGFFDLFSILSQNYDLSFHQKWMKLNILVQFFAARNIKIFSEYSGDMLDLFWTYFGTKIGFFELFSI